MLTSPLGCTVHKGTDLWSPPLLCPQLPGRCLAWTGHLFWHRVISLTTTESFPPSAAASPLSCVQLFATPWTIDSPPRSSVRGIFPARILERIAISFSQGIFLTKGSNLCLLLGRQIFYHRVTREAHLFM